MRKVLSLTVRIKLEFFPEKESNPFIHCWSSNKHVRVFHSRSNRLDPYCIIPLDGSGTDFTPKFALNVEVTEPFTGDIGDVIGIEVLANTLNEEKTMAVIRLGDSLFSMMGIFKSQEDIILKEKIILPDYSALENHPVCKGEISISIAVNTTSSKWQMSEYSANEVNGKFLEFMFDQLLRKEHAIVNAVRDKKIPVIEPSHREVASCHLWLWMTEEGPLPAISFWILKKERFEDSEYFSRTQKSFLSMLNAVLERHNTDMETFKFKMRSLLDNKSKYVNADHIEAVRLIGSLVTCFATSLPYISDIYHKKKKSGTGFVISKEMVELFSDAARLLCGDCEDLGKLCYRVCFCLQEALWTDEVLTLVKRVLLYYIPYGGLGTVTSRYLGEKESKANCPLIGSKEDENVEAGFHIWAYATPVKITLHCLEKTNSMKLPVIDYAPPLACEDDLPILLFEGTGLMDSLLKPVEDYYHNEVDKQSAQAALKSRLHTTEKIMDAFPILRGAHRESFQTATGKKGPFRLSPFYRRQTRAYTKWFIDRGIPIGGFLWILIENIDGKEVWKYGANMRDILYSGDPKSNAAMIAFPHYEKEEILGTRESMKRLVPAGTILYPQDDDWILIKQRIDERCASLNHRLGRNLATDNDAQSCKGTFFLFKEEHTSSGAMDSLLKSISESRDFMAKFALEIFTKEVINFRLTICIRESESHHQKQIRDSIHSESPNLEKFQSFGRAFGWDNISQTSTSSDPNLTGLVNDTLSLGFEHFLVFKNDQSGLYATPFDGSNKEKEKILHSEKRQTKDIIFEK